MARKLQISQVVAKVFLLLAASTAVGAEFHPPAGQRYAATAPSGTVLPGGRFLRPFGAQIQTGPGTLGLAVSSKGTVATADTGFERYGITVIDPPGKNPWKPRHIWARTPGSSAPEIADPEWKGVTAGIAFDSEKAVWISEGASGRIRQVDISTGGRRKVVSLNGAAWHDSFTANLVFDSARHLLLVADQFNKRVAIVDARAGKVLASVKLERTPFALAFSPDGETAYAGEEDDVCVIDLRDPLKPVITGRIPAPSAVAVLAAAGRIFIANALHDSITAVSASDYTKTVEISLGMPSLEQYRGVAPAGMAYDPLTKWLLVAEAGVNALGVVDTEKNEVIGHIPAGWMPAQVVVSGDRVYVANAGGRGTGPTQRRISLEMGEVALLHQGSVSTFVMPDANEVLRQTQVVFAYNGFAPYMRDAPKPPAAIRHVVLIVKEGRTFDEVFGDVIASSNGRALGAPALARFGLHGRALGGRMQFSVQDAQVTPNQHSVARQWSFSDNFYTDGETAAEGNRRLEGGYSSLPSYGGLWLPGALDAGALWNHLEKADVQFRKFADIDDPNISDQARADKVIAEIDRQYGAAGGPELPRFIYIRLPNDRTADPKPQIGYQYEASYVADNDLAAGRLLDYFSHSRWWRGMAVFMTESDTGGGPEHVDSHRTLMLAAGPWIKRNYVSHTNSNFAGLLRTIFEVLGVPPLHLADATGASLRDMFAEDADFNPYTTLLPDHRIFDPAAIQPAAAAP